MARDYNTIHYIHENLIGFKDDRITQVVVNIFNVMNEGEEPDGAFRNSIELYVALKYYGYNPILCYGLVTPKNGASAEFYHAWIEIDTKVIDVSIYGTSLYSPFVKVRNIVSTPIIYKDYGEIEEVAYGKFVFDEDWEKALIQKMQGMRIIDYCDNSPMKVVWKLLCKAMDMSPTIESVNKLKAVIGDDVI